MNRVVLDLDALEIQHLDVIKAAAPNTIEFEMRGTIRDLDDETITEVANKRIEPLELVCRELHLEE